MIESQSLPLILLACILVLLFAAVGTLVWGRRLPRSGDWLAGVGLAFPAGALVLATHALSQDSWKSIAWLRGWVWPPSSEGAITVGLSIEPIGLIFSFLIILVSAVVLANRSALRQQPHPERVLSAAAFGAAGAILSWLSSTPWLSFVGLALATLGGFVALLCHWDDDYEATTAARFGWERSGGPRDGDCRRLRSRGGAHGAGLGIDRFGRVESRAGCGRGRRDRCFALGARTVFAVRSLSVTGRTLRPFRTCSWSHILIAQLLPAWAAFAVLFRLAPILGGVPSVPVLAWFMVGSGMLNFGLGAFAVRRKNLAELLDGRRIRAGERGAFSGRPTSGPLAFLRHEPRRPRVFRARARCSIRPIRKHLKRRPNRSRSGAGWRVSPGSPPRPGLPGFISAGGAIQWIESLFGGQPALAALAAISLGLFTALGWKLFFVLRGRRAVAGVRSLVILLPIVVVLPALGLFSSWPGNGRHFARGHGSGASFLFRCIPRTAEGRR